MSSTRRCLLAIAAILLCRLALALTICGACGHELADGQAFCGHCGARSGAAETAAAAPEEKGSETAAQTDGIDSAAFLEAAREDGRIAAELEERQPEVAFFYYRNAAALTRLVPDSSLAPETGRKLIESVERCKRRMARTMKGCEVCAGTGRRTMVMQSLGMDGSSGQTMRGAGMVCTACNGSGRVLAQRNAEEMRLLLAQGARSHELRQQTARRVGVGNAWVPAAAAAGLRPRQQALLRGAMAAPCGDCQGLGVQVCRACAGQGRVPCRERGCVNGMVERKQSNTLSPATTLNIKAQCPSCKGNGWISCADCGGSGHVACRACNGLGRPEKCRKCGGAGTAACAVCRGTGRDRGGQPCAACLGDGIGLCPTCHGEGCASK